MIIKKKLKSKKKPTEASESPKAGYSSLTIEQAKKKLASYLRKGLSIKDAQLLSGISNTVLGLLRSDPDFEDFLQECKARHKMNHLNNIQDAAEGGNWSASAWVLERTHPDEFGKKDTVKHKYEIKINMFIKEVLAVLAEVDPSVRAKVMQRLKNINTKQLASGVTNECAVEPATYELSPIGAEEE